MTSQGYIPRDLSFDDDARQKLIQGITSISKAVKSTLGPLGKTVLIESADHLKGITITKDGVTVAQSVFLDDPIENLAIQMMKDAANRTANTAGDGTTTAIVLTEALVKAGQGYIQKDTNVTEVIRHINKITQDVIQGLEKHSKKVSSERLLDVACISANNDREIGTIIADAYEKVGINGIVTVENSMTAETYAEVTNGIKVARGYTSNMFINNQKKDECVLEGVKILVCDAEISNVLQIENILKPIIQNNDKLLMFCNIIPPNFGYKSTELMSDIAFAVGAKFFSEKTGDDLSLIRMEDLGYADKIVAGKDSTIIFKTDNNPEATKERIDELKVQQKGMTIKHEREFVNERIASLAGAIGCIYVGGNSDVEQNKKKSMTG